MPDIESVYIIYSADVLGVPSEIERMAPANHLPAGYSGDAASERARIAAKFTETEDDDEYQFGYLGEETGNVTYFPFGYKDAEGHELAEEGEPSGDGLHRKWVGELTADEWQVFAEAYCIDLTDDGQPERYTDTMGSLTLEYGHIAAVAVENTEGWNSNVIDSTMYVSFACKDNEQTGVSS